MLDKYQIFNIALILFGAASAFACTIILRLKKENLPYWEKLPRNVWVFGAAFTVADVLLCIPHAEPVLPASINRIIIPLAVIGIVIFIKFLDYLFARALGGFFILMAHYFLHDSFTFHTPLSWLFAVFCFAFGIIGLFLAGKPYLMRDFIRKATKENYIKYIVAVYFGLLALICVFDGVFQILRGQGV